MQLFILVYLAEPKPLEWDMHCPKSRTLNSALLITKMAKKETWTGDTAAADSTNTRQ